MDLQLTRKQLLEQTERADHLQTQLSEAERAAAEHATQRQQWAEQHRLLRSQLSAYLTPSAPSAPTLSGLNTSSASAAASAAANTTTTGSSSSSSTSSSSGGTASTADSSAQRQLEELRDELEARDLQLREKTAQLTVLLETIEALQQPNSTSASASASASAGTTSDVKYGSGSGSGSGPESATAAAAGGAAEQDARAPLTTARRLLTLAAQLSAAKAVLHPLPSHHLIPMRYALLI